MEIIRGKKIWYANGFRPADIALSEDGKIQMICPYGTYNENEACITDYNENRILPGFIDVHTHGAYGYDTNDAKPDKLREWIRRIPEEGVTALLPTTVTQLPDVLMAAAASVADIAEEKPERSAEILGIHFEGPYFDMEYKGAQPPEAIKDATVEEFKHFQDAARGWIKYMSLAPEHDKNQELTRYLSENGIVVSIGHSSADFETVLMAVANGARSQTHVCNAMTGLKHRAPGQVGAAFRIRDIFGEMICDTQHVKPDVVNIYFDSKGRDYTMMVSDSLRCKSAAPGQEFTLGGHKITLDESGLARLSDGTIAGSTMKMNEGLRNLIEECMVPAAAAINACTINPARCLRVDDRKGRIAAGYDADIVILDRDYKVVQTYCRGKKAL